MSDSSETTGRKSFFDRRDRWGHGLALWVLLVMVFTMPLAWWSLKQVDIKNDVENWLPSDDPSAVALRWYSETFPVEDRIIVSWDDNSLFDPRVEQFARRLEGTLDAEGVRRGGLDYVASVDTPHQALRQITRRDVAIEEAVRRMEGVLIGTGPFKVALTDAGRESLDRTQRMLAERAREELAVELEFLPRASEPILGLDESFEETDDDTEPGDGDEAPAEATDDDSNGLYAELTQLWREHDFQVAWPAMHADAERLEQFRKLAEDLTRDGEDDALIDDCFLMSGSPVAVSVKLSEAGSEDRTAAFAAIRQIAVDVGVDETKLRFGGRPVAGHALNQSVKEAAWNRAAPVYLLHERSPVLLSGVVSVLLAFLMLRSARLATLVLIIAFYAAMMAVALVPPTGGSMNMVLVVMPTLLMVLTVSAAIHVANYWKHAAYRDLPSSIVEAVRTARTPCLLAAGTTAIGLLSLATSPLAPVRDFGLYASVGCAISLVAALVCLPSLMQFWPGRKPGISEVDHSAWRMLGGWLCRHRTAVSVSCVVLFAVCTAGLKYFQTETKVIRYFRDHTRVVQDYNALEETLSGIIPVDVIIRFGPDAVRVDDEGVRDLNFFERLEVVRRIQDSIRGHREISGAISLADFQPVRQPPEGGSRLTWLRYHRRSSETERRVKEEDSGASRLLVTAERETPGICDKGDELWRITAQAAIMSDTNYGDLTAELNNIVQSELKLIPGSGHVVTGTVPIFLRTQQAVLESLIRSFGLAFIVIAIVMMILLRNPLAGLTTMLPNLLPVGIVFGLISWAGWRVDIGTMITASVALGIAVDGTLHLLTWFRAGLAEGHNRTEAIQRALSHCGPAMWQTSAAVGVGLAMLCFADLLLISRFGGLMAALIGAALLADVIFLPALLAGPLGSLIERKVSPSNSSAAEERSEEDTDVHNRQAAHRVASGADTAA